jgi:HEAT repeat protein
MRTRSLHVLLRCLVALAMTGFAAAALADDTSAEKEKGYLATLRSDGPGGEKALACKGLAVHGSAAAVPDLAKLLGDEKLSSWTRIALEAIPGPEADEALRTAAQALEGRLLIGVINSIGVREDAKAVDGLAKRLSDKDVEVASAAAVALGKIGDAAATKALQQALTDAPENVRTAVAEGCILCAEKLLAAGDDKQAAELYDEIRQAEVAKPRILEATRGAILARKNEGIPLLLEQIRSADKHFFRLGLTTARELPGAEVTAALASEVGKSSPESAALLLTALGDRNDPAALPAVITAANTGTIPVRIAAVAVIGRLGDASSIATLLEMAGDANAELSGAAKEALAGLTGEKVNAEIVARLDKAQGKTLSALIGLIGQRRIEATPALVKALNSKDAEVRTAALTALGETVGQDQLSVLINQAVTTKNEADAKVALQALRVAAVRMPDTEVAAAQLAAALPKAPATAKVSLLETLGTMGGNKALDTLVATVKGSDDELRDTSSKMLGEWMSVDAGPKLLDLAKNAPTDKYRVRALRGYIRLARQFTMPDAQRAQMLQSAFTAATRDDERQLVLPILERYPSLGTLEVAINATKTPSLKEDATRVALVVAQKVDKKAEAQAMLAKMGLERMKIEIVKAQYGAGSTQKDVTDVLKKQVGEYPVIVLPAATYTASFGGDPVPGTPKQLTIEYKIDGKAGKATFPENTPVVLPIPKS